MECSKVDLGNWISENNVAKCDKGTLLQEKLDMENDLGRSSR